MIQWVTCDPVTGEVIESLPGARLESSLPCYVGRGDTIKISIPVESRPARWRIATEPLRAVLVAHYDDDYQTILWAGPIRYQEYGSGATIIITAQSVDGWLAEQYTGTVFAAAPDNGVYSVINRDPALILADMLAVAATTFHGAVNVTLCGSSMNYSAADSDDKTCAAVISAIMALDGGPEYKIGWTWDAAGCLAIVVTVAPHIGTTAPAVLLSGVEWTYTNDATAGKGATIVTAVATNTGSVRNQATRAATELLAAGYIPVELRFTPDTGVSSTALLGLAADSKLAVVRQGTASVALTFHPDGPWRINRDIQVGDVFAVDLENPDMPEVSMTMTARMLGFVAEADKISGEIVKITPVTEEA